MQSTAIQPQMSWTSSTCTAQHCKPCEIVTLVCGSRLCCTAPVATPMPGIAKLYLKPPSNLLQAANAATGQKQQAVMKGLNASACRHQTPKHSSSCHITGVQLLAEVCCAGLKASDIVSACESGINLAIRHLVYARCWNRLLCHMLNSPLLLQLLAAAAN